MATFYTPDVWVILKITDTGIDMPVVYYKVLAGWYGGFAKGDEWKINSGISKIKENDNLYIIEGYSGNQYICRKDSEKVSILTHSVAESMKKLPKLNVEIVSIDSIKEIFK